MAKNLSEYLDFSYKRAFGWDAFVSRSEADRYLIIVFLLIKGHYFDSPRSVSDTSGVQDILGDITIGPGEFYRLADNFTKVVAGPFTWEEVKGMRDRKLANYRERVRLKEEIETGVVDSV